MRQRASGLVSFPETLLLVRVQADPLPLALAAQRKGTPMTKSQQELDEMWEGIRAWHKEHGSRRKRFLHGLGVFIAFLVAFTLYGIAMNGSGAWR